MSDRETLIEFPSRFPIKVMGEAHPELMQAVEACVAEHVPDAGDAVIQQRASSGGRFVGITITFTATSQDQLDGLYQALGRCDRVRMIL
ncbi:YbeD family protein [Thioalkalivibrio sp. ALJT]|uniref:YbeD family protein n=1 Tax=Thioalkalivibrio sp. ALJT TaxID=1158146 RepID=UPI00035C319A|nr:DUF493 domain-containing protein [Thioalkalivibrio sp. ALJT]